MIGGLDESSATLLDCASLWLSNSLLAEHHLADRSAALLKSVGLSDGPLVIVSNEVGQGILVVAGLPMVLKGQLPEGLS